MTEIDRILTRELEARYSIGKTALTDRLNALGIPRIRDGKRSYVAAEWLQALDELDSRLKSGGTLPQAGELMSESRGEVATARQFTLVLPQLEVLNESVEKLIKKGADETAPYRQLLYFAENRIRIPSSVVRSLTGRTPKGERFYWGSFEFLKILPQDSPNDGGRMGRERCWLVKRVTTDA